MAARRPSSRHTSLALCFIFAAACSSNSGSKNNDAGAGTDAGNDGGTHPDGGTAGLPTAPVLSATTTLTTITLTWTTSDTSAETYSLVRSTDEGSTFTAVASAPGLSALTFTDTAVRPGLEYRYRVAATNPAGAGPGSNVVIVLQASSDLSTAGTDRRILLTWGQVQHANSYDVYRVPSSGAPTLLGNTAKGEYADTTVTPGTTYSYQIICKAAGYVSSIGSDVATGAALGIEITGTLTYVGETTTATYAALGQFGLLGLEAHVALADGGTKIYGSVATTDNLIIPDVPEGPYAITVSGYKIFSITSARSLDYSGGYMGRFDTVDSRDDNTRLDYDLTGLVPWVQADAGVGASDSVESISQGAGNFVSDLELAIPAPPDAGSTVFAGDEVTTDEGGDGFLVDSSKGDVLYLWQLHPTASGNGQTFLTAQRTFADTRLTMVAAADNPVDGGMSTPAATTIPDLKIARAAWSARVATTNPAAVDKGSSLYIDVERKYDTYGFYGSSGDALIYDGPAGTTDLDLGSVAWQSPVSASAAWDTFVFFMANQTVHFAVGTGSTDFTTSSIITEPIGAGFDWTTALAPTLSQPRAPLVNGQNAFADQASVADANGVVTLSWAAPATGTPDFYFVTVYELDAGGQVKKLENFDSKSTTLALTSELLPDSVYYFATIDAVQQRRAGAPLDPTVRPIDVGSTYISSEIVTNKFSRTANPFGSRNVRNMPPAAPATTTARLPADVRIRVDRRSGMRRFLDRHS